MKSWSLTERKLSRKGLWRGKQTWIAQRRSAGKDELERARELKSELRTTWIDEYATLELAGVYR